MLDQKTGYITAPDTSRHRVSMLPTLSNRKTLHRKMACNQGRSTTARRRAANMAHNRPGFARTRSSWRSRAGIPDEILNNKVGSLSFCWRQSRSPATCWTVGRGASFTSRSAYRYRTINYVRVPANPQPSLAFGAGSDRLFQHAWRQQRGHVKRGKPLRSENSTKECSNVAK